MEHQNTIKSKFTVSGKGLHYGNNINVTLLPAEP
ncbi:MAG TPA: UDP-3-O-[3-hydroxymyristoyl] N-acetylglucosamine deacetylase, partial [Bacteroidales bacterium]|nr:UDP-3-O-[3-hydroxymyristoyl] N-acetylglucosamine deacetylase [Bacteroidales bacterium]